MADEITNLGAKKESTVKDFLEVTFRRKWVIVGIVVVATLSVLLLNMRQGAEFESMGRILVQRGEATGVFGMKIRTLSWEEEMASQIEMIKSDVVAGRAREIVSDLFPEGFESDERLSPWRIGAGVVGTSNVLWISYTSSDPVFCRAAADAVMRAYKEYYLNARTPPEMEDFFSEELSNLQSEISHLRSRKARLEIESGIIDVDQQSSTTLSRLAILTTELDEIRRDIAEKQRIIQKLDDFRELSIDEQAAVSNTLRQEGAKQTVIESYTQQLMKLRMEESELSVKYTDEHRDLKRVRKQIEDLYIYLDKEIQSFKIVTEARLDLLHTSEGLLLSQIASLETEKKVIPGLAIELHSIDKSLLRAEEQYADLSKQQIEARLTKASNPEWNITILSAASPAYQKRTVDYVRMALGPLFSLVVALGFAFFIDNLDHSIKNVAEAEEALGCQVLASFPDSEQ
jgi:uncharacterized protein involved in exopolysaccharide biosynthesis